VSVWLFAMSASDESQATSKPTCAPTPIFVTPCSAKVLCIRRHSASICDVFGLLLPLFFFFLTVSSPAEVSRREAARSGLCLRQGDPRTPPASRGSRVLATHVSEFYRLISKHTRSLVIATAVCEMSAGVLYLFFCCKSSSVVVEREKKTSETSINVW
jgi:hypothetical protein